MYAHLLRGNREIFVLPSVVVPRAASGRPEAITDDARDEEVMLVDSTCEACEQSGAIRQKDRFAWDRITKLADDFLPKPKVLHPWSQQRFAVRYSR